MRARVALLGALGALAVAAPAAPASDDPAQLAAAVERDVVHVDPRASRRLSEAEAGKLRLRILDRDLGRIRILVVPPAAAERNGGIASLANDVASRTELRGALIVVAGTSVWISTTYDSGPALAAVQRAMAGRNDRRLAAGLTRAVDGIARADPGPSADSSSGPGAPGVPSVPGDGGFGEVVDDIGDAVRVVVFGIGGAVLLAVLIPLLVFGVRARRRRAETAEDVAVARENLEADHVAIGDILRDMDIDAEMPGADPAGREALGRAIELYDRAGRELPRANTHRRLHRAQSTLAQARTAAEDARRRLSGEPAPLSIDS